MSGACSGSVLTLGMRRKSFSSERSRSLFVSTNALVERDTFHYRSPALVVLVHYAYWLVDFLPPLRARAAPAPPPAIAPTMPTFAPVDIPVWTAGALGVA